MLSLHYFVLWFRRLQERNRTHCLESGAALVEFAFVAPIFFGILFFTFEMGMMMLIKLNLQQGVDAGARLGPVAAATVDNTIRQQMQSFILPTQVVITIQSYPSFAAISGSNPNDLTAVNTGVPGTGNPGDVVRYQVLYTYQSLSPVVWFYFGSQVALTAITVAKNETAVC